MLPSDVLRIQILLHSLHLKQKSKQLVTELLDSTYKGSLKNAGVYLEISLLDCLTTINSRTSQGLFQNFSKIPGLSRTLFIFQDFTGLLGTMCFLYSFFSVFDSLIMDQHNYLNTAISHSQFLSKLFKLQLKCYVIQYIPNGV